MSLFELSLLHLHRAFSLLGLIDEGLTLCDESPFSIELDVGKSEFSWDTVDLPVELDDRIGSPIEYDRISVNVKRVVPLIERQNFQIAGLEVGQSLRFCEMHSAGIHDDDIVRIDAVQHRHVCLLHCLVARRFCFKHFLLDCLRRNVTLRFCNARTRQRNEPVGSSRVDLQACKLEYSIVSPK